MKITPKEIYSEYQKAREYKSQIGDKGIYEQNKRNERFFVGDQWHGAKCGSDRPLVRYNIIKRIGEYKKAMIGASPIAIMYSADGVPNTLGIADKISEVKKSIANGEFAEFDTNTGEIPDVNEINLVMSALGDYEKTTAERLKYNQLLAKVLDNAYISGESILYTYWNPDIKTGLYADDERKVAITGDIDCDVLDIENVYYGDAQCEEIQNQPFIIISQRKSVAELKREAKRNRAGNVDDIKADKDNGYEAGDRSELEPDETKKATVLTKMWKEYGDNGDYTIKAIKVTENVVIRKEWDLNVRLYPLASFRWDIRRNSAYGESEITYLIPNQIAINRMITSNVWAVMIKGMPIMLVDGEVITGPVTNDPGQIIKCYGNTAGAISYVNPPNFSPAFNENIASLVSQTMMQAGANDAALGNMNPDNTSAIIALREAATMPLQMLQNRYYQFCEDVARIWADFWVSMYGKRSLKISDENGTWYMPFDSERYKTLLISVKVDVGASTLWSESQSVRTLDNLLERQIIDVIQYLDRLPKGTIPKVDALIKELKIKASAQPQEVMSGQVGGGNVPTAPDEQLNDMSVKGILDSLPEDKRELFINLPKEAQIKMLQQSYTDAGMIGGMANDGGAGI
ncbi:MAG: hypothetical protein II305_06175 [Clostridia bacterium]|nr:hypothetical protein [Clostridia bacterium]MBQ5716442.1 hypothetical protein [Clostridia bacterium]